MNVRFQDPGFSYSVDSILLFQTEAASPFWSGPLLHFYPQIDGAALQKLDAEGRRQYLSDVLYDVYRELEPELDRKALAYQDRFASCRRQIDDALSDAFALDAASVFNDLTANITLNPICPRFLRERRFDVFYMNSPRGAIGMSIHEMIHYLWFSVWNRHFKDSYDEYETPSMKWLLSEMVVESIMRDERLSSINPYFPRESGGGCIYLYFFDMTADGVPVLDTIDRLYRENGITDFMEAAYRYCLRHEAEIRAHVADAEGRV